MKSDQNAKSGLPRGWVECSIGQMTLPVSKIDPKEDPDREIDYIDIASIDNSRQVVGKVTQYQLKDAPSRARQIVRSGDVLFATVRPYLRNIASVPKDYDQQIASTGFSVLRPAEGICPAFLFYKVISRDFVNALAGIQYGVSYPAVKDEQVRDQLLWLPPLREQRRIVAKIEELSSELDKGIESLKAARAKLNIYRQAVLKHAFEGKLTAQWREENKDKLETPEQLLARIKQEREARYEQQLQEWEAAGEQGSKPKAPKAPPLLTAEELAELPELPEGWVWTRFGLLDIELKRGPFGSSITKSMFVPSGFKVYEQGNAIYRDASRGSYFINDEKYKELSAFTVSPGDFIVSCAGTVGRIFELPENAMAGVINQALMRVRINDMILSKRFFAKLFESAFFQRKVLSDAKGTAMVNLAGIKELNLVPVAICNMSEQKVIDELLDARLSEIDQCERAIATSFQQAEALRQSILKRAFSGQLVPQDPDDEPASILLERIKAEKAARSQNNTRAKRRRTTATA